MAKYHAMQIAHWFLKRNEQVMDEKGAEKMSLFKLLKLLYYSEGCYLAMHSGVQLFGEPILAWEHGPVVEKVYQKYQQDPYNLVLTDDDERDAEQISRDDQEMLNQVFEVFGKYSAWALRDRTREETPWLETTKNGTVLNGVIHQATMQDYFLKNYIEQ